MYTVNSHQQEIKSNENHHMKKHEKVPIYHNVKAEIHAEFEKY